MDERYNYIIRTVRSAGIVRGLISYHFICFDACEIGRLKTYTCICAPGDDVFIVRAHEYVCVCLCVCARVCLSVCLCVCACVYSIPIRPP